MSKIIGKTIEYAKTHELEGYNGGVIYSFIKTSDGMIFYTMIDNDESVLDYSPMNCEDYMNLIKELELTE